MRFQINEPMRYDVPVDVDFKKIYELLLNEGYTAEKVGNALGYKGSVTKMLNSGRVEYYNGARLLALAEDSLSVRQLNECVTGYGYEDHEKPLKIVPEKINRWPVRVDTYGLICEIRKKGISAAHIARSIGVVESTITNVVSRRGEMKAGGTLRILSYAQSVLSEEEFNTYVKFESAR